MFEYAAAGLIVGALVVVFVLLRELRRRSRRPTERRRTSESLVGILFQGIGFALAFGVREQGAGLFEGWPLEPRLLSGVAFVLALIAAVIVFWAQTTLGAQWSLTARLSASALTGRVSTPRARSRSTARLLPALTPIASPVRRW